MAATPCGLEDMPGGRQFEESLEEQNGCDGVPAVDEIRLKLDENSPPRSAVASALAPPRCLSLADYVWGTGTPREATAAGGLLMLAALRCNERGDKA